MGHMYSAATCTTPKTCTTCGATTGNAAGHTWKDATYTTPKTCAVCGETSGEPLTKPWETRDVEGGVEITGIGIVEASGNYVIPSEIDGKTVVGIGEYAFYYNTIKSIIIPDTVTYIGASAFSNVRELTTISIPSSVKQIGTNAFLPCASLSTVYILSSDLELGNYVFSSIYNRNCTLTIYAPATLMRKLMAYDAEIVEWNG